MTRLFVTGTGTDIGKSFVTAVLAKRARRAGRSVSAVKPVASGFQMAALAQSDPVILLAAQGLGPESLDRIAPWRFAAPLSPDMAAAREGRSIDFAALTSYCRQLLDGPDEIVLIEGVGGVMVPLDSRHTVLDWIAVLGAPAILVAGSYLGTISHTLTALGMLDLRGCAVRAIVVSESIESPVALDETAAAIGRFAGAAEILTIRRFPDDAALAVLDPLIAR